MLVWTALPHFVWTKHRYFHQCQPDPLSAPDSACFQQLLQDGVVVRENFLPAKTVAAIRDEVQTSGMLEHARSKSYHRDGVCIVEQAAQWLPTAQCFYQHPMIRQMAQAYLAQRAMQFRQIVNYKTQVGQSAQPFELFFHFDDWKPRFKAFLYLTDVGEQEAPLVYLKGSHRGLWRLWKETELFCLYRQSAQGFADNWESLFLGCYFPHQARRLQELWGWQPQVCTGTAGTVIFFDGRGLHRGNWLQRNQRLLLGSLWKYEED